MAVKPLIVVSRGMQRNMLKEKELYPKTNIHINMFFRLKCDCNIDTNIIQQTIIFDYDQTNKRKS